MDASRALAAIGEADSAPLDVRADLSVSVDGDEITVESYTDRIVVGVPSMRVVVALLRRARGLVPGVARVLAAADLTALVQVDGTAVAVLGAEARSGRLSNRLDAPIAVRLDGVLSAVVGALL